MLGNSSERLKWPRVFINSINFSSDFFKCLISEGLNIADVEGSCGLEGGGMTVTSWILEGLGVGLGYLRPLLLIYFIVVAHKLYITK